MKDILTAPFVEEMKRTTANMYRLGWDERNGGNISMLLDEAQVGEYLDLNKVIRTIPTGFKADSLIGKIFIVTGTGKYFKNVEINRRENTEKYVKDYSLEDKRIIVSSDAHYLTDMRDKENYFELDDEPYSSSLVRTKLFEELRK